MRCSRRSRGDIVGPVQTDFGWHVIRVTGVKPETPRPFDEVKAQIEADLKRQKAQQKFAAAADQFQNLVYEQADSLAPVGKTLELTVQTTPLVTRAQVQQLALGNAKFVQAVFSPESIPAKRNTEAIEVGAEHADGRAHRRIQAGGAAAVRRSQGRDPPAARAEAAAELAQKAGPREARAARAGQERQGGRRRRSASRSS